MKKLLLATAAVIALSATAAHAEVKLDLGGYFKGYAGYADQDTANLREFDFKRKTQIAFTGETTLDNGLTVGYNGTLFQENNNTGDGASSVNDISASSNTAVEQSYLYFSGNWGRVNAGRANGAAYLLQVSAPSADSNIDGQDIDISFYNPGGSALQSYKHAGPENNNGIAANQYADKVTYLTPKFNGFQAGVSYSAQADNKVFGNNVAGSQADNTSGGFEDAYEGAVRYDGEFSNVGIHAGAGYTVYGQEVETAANDDFKEFSAGLKLTYDAFGLGVAYNTDNNSLEDNGDREVLVVGADYTFGAYKFGASWMNSQADVTASTEDELDRYSVGATYTFGPGMDFRGAVAYYDESAAVVANSNDATIVTVGTDVQF